MQVQDLTPPPVRRNDGATELSAFGILSGLIGFFLFWPSFVILVVTVVDKFDPRGMGFFCPVAGVGLILSIALMDLGAGSTRHRRSARALLLILSWSWLALGILGGCRVMFDTVQAIGAPGGAPKIIGLVCWVIVLYVAPAVWIKTYQNEKIKALCERDDPQEQWTDRIPLAIIAMSLWFGAGALIEGLAAISYKGMAPFFTVTASGGFGLAIRGVLFASWGYCAWGFFKRVKIAWWIGVVSLAVVAGSLTVFYWWHDPLELHAAFGYAGAQVALTHRAESAPLLEAPSPSLLLTCAMTVYALFLRRFFFRTGLRDP